jgi:LPXTG-motif cell wall-anchored protein
MPEIYFKVVNGEVVYTDSEGVEKTLTDGELVEQPIKYQLKSASDPATVTVTNYYGFELPHTGGPGTRIFTLCGIALLALAGVIYTGFKTKGLRLFLK